MCTKSEYSLVPDLGSTPWVVFIHGNYSQIQTFYNFLDGSLHHRSIPELREKICFGCCNGHLMLVDIDSNECNLLNLRTMEVISLPPLTPTFSDYNYFFLLPPPSRNHVNFMVFTVRSASRELFREMTNEIMIWRRGDKEWRTLHRVFVRDIGCINSGIVKPNGDVYLLGGFSKLIVVDASSLVVRLIDVETIVSRQDLYLGRQSFLQFDGELFVVDVYVQFPNKFLCAEVYKLNETELKWKKVESIGQNRAIFLGSFVNANEDGFMVEDPRVKGDSIYFVKSSHDGTRLYRFSLEEGEIIFDKLICPKLNEAWCAARSCYLAMA